MAKFIVQASKRPGLVSSLPREKNRIVTDPKEAALRGIRVGDTVRAEPPAPVYAPTLPAAAKKAPAKKKPAAKKKAKRK